MRGGIGLRDRIGHSAQQRVRKRNAVRGGNVDKTAGEIGVVCRERGIDLPFNRAGIIARYRIELNLG
jgi:hypothetical protein